MGSQPPNPAASRRDAPESSAASLPFPRRPTRTASSGDHRRQRPSPTGRGGRLSPTAPAAPRGGRLTPLPTRRASPLPSPPAAPTPLPPRRGPAIQSPPAAPTPLPPSQGPSLQSPPAADAMDMPVSTLVRNLIAKVKSLDSRSSAPSLSNSLADRDTEVLALKDKIDALLAASRDADAAHSKALSQKDAEISTLRARVVELEGRVDELVKEKEHEEGGSEVVLLSCKR